MPRSLLAVLLLASGFAALLALARPASAQAEGELVDGIVAVVGTEPILRSDVEALAFTYARGGALTDELRRAALRELVGQRVVAAHAERDTTVQVTPDEVNEALDQRTDQLVRQVGSEEAVEELYGKSLAQLKEDYRDEVRRQLRAQRFQQREYFRVRITPPEVRQWFREIPADSIPEVPELIRVSHIVRFPTVNPAAEAEARAEVAAIRDSIATAAATIEEMAERYSDDPGSNAAGQGGRYAAINLRDLVPEFGAVASRLQPGELSQPFETEFGYHVMRLNQRRGDVVDFNHVLIRVDDTQTDPSDAVETLAMLRDSVLTGGASFARLAREFSEDEPSAVRGGAVVVPQTGDRDLRFEALSPRWQATLGALAVGEISEPAEVDLLDGRSAYHIALLERRVPPHRLSLETDYPLIEEFALQEKRQRELARWAEELRADVYIACKDPTYCSDDLGALSADF